MQIAILLVRIYRKDRGKLQIPIGEYRCSLFGTAFIRDIEKYPKGRITRPASIRVRLKPRFGSISVFTIYDWRFIFKGGVPLGTQQAMDLI